MRKWIGIGILAIVLVWPVMLKATANDAREKAEEIHKRASSDVIYADQEIHAIYYQNEQIIGLLEEIRDLMKAQAVLLETEKKS